MVLNARASLIGLLILVACLLGIFLSRKSWMPSAGQSEHRVRETESKSPVFALERKLPKKLKEISGLDREGSFLWAISDAGDVPVYKLDLQGEIVQEINLKGVELMDVEAVCADRDFLYVGDIGDNDGSRGLRTIYRIRKSSIGSDPSVKVRPEAISFQFPQSDASEKKGENLYDCESMIAFQGALYLFTKRRGDLQTELFSILPIPGPQQPRSLAVFDAVGLVTDAAVNTTGNEIALIGYEAKHQESFVLLLDQFKGNAFFSGRVQRLALDLKGKNWQTEGITYGEDNSFYLSCEKTSDVDATLYRISRSHLLERPAGRPASHH